MIVIGPDEDLRRVLAPSITAFLADAAARLQVFRRLGGRDPVLFFDMEDRQAARNDGS